MNLIPPKLRSWAASWVSPLAPAPPLLALPEPVAARVARLEKALGIILFEGGDSAAIVRVRPGRRSDPVSALGLSSAAPDLYRALQTGVPWLTLLNRALPVDTAAFAASLKRASEQLPGSVYADLLEAVRAWAMPAPTHPLVAREAVLWAPSEFCTAVVGSSALVDAKVVGYADYGRLLSAVLTRRPRANGSNGASTSMSHPLLALPAAELWLERDYYRYQGSAYAIWLFTPRDAQSLVDLQALNVDILLHLENVDGALWAVCLLRGSGPDGASLREVEAEISAFGAVERIPSVHPLPGHDLTSAFRAFVPGGSSPKGSRISVEASEEFLRSAVVGIDSHAAATGNTFLGAADQKPVFINRGPLAVIGPTGVGKTTYAAFLALQSSPFGLVIHFTNAEGEAPPRWAQEFGGQVLSPTFAPGEGRGEETVRIEAWRAWSERFWAQTAEVWEKDPLGAAGLPLVLRRGGGSPVQFVALAQVFLLGFLEAWKARYARTRQPGFVVLDDLVGIPGAAADVNLGTLPSEVGRQLRETIQQLVDAGRKSGLWVILTAHSREEFTAWPVGTLESLPHLIVLEPNSAHGTARLVDPRVPVGSGDLFSFNPRLPRTVVEKLGGPVGLNLPPYPGDD